MIKITPSSLALVGVAIIILGVLIPSIFIDAFSTIGFSIVFGLLIILSAYLIFSINTVKTKGTRSVKWLLLPLLLILIITGGFYTNYSYQQNKKDKVYAVGDVVELLDFDFIVTEIKSNPVSIDTKDIDLSNRKECNDTSHECTWYNWSRQDAQNYLNDYDESVTIEYELTAKDVVQTDDLTVTILPDSGREIAYNTGSQSSDLNDNLSWFLWVLKLDYTANPKSDFGGNVNQGILRKGTVGVDLKKTEQVFDVIVEYQGETRIVRVKR
jgi:hypothetical protein